MLLTGAHHESKLSTMSHETQQETGSNEVPEPNKAKATRKAKIPAGLRFRSGQYYTVISIGNGKQWRKKAGTSNLELAKKILAKRRTLVAEGRWLDVKEERLITVRELCQQYWAARGPELVKAKGNHALVKFFQNGRLAHTRVCDLTEELVSTVLNEREQAVKDTPHKVGGGVNGFSSSTRNRCQVKLQTMIRWAITSKKLDENPIAGMKKRREGDGRTTHLEQPEITELLDCLETTGAKQWWRDFIVASISTACRRAELMKMHFTDLNFTARTLTVQAENSKTMRSRTLPMDDMLYTVLERRFRERVGSNPHVFSYEGEAHKGVNVNAIHRAWHQTVKDSPRLRQFTLYHLRHSTLTHWANNGIALTTVQRMAGHSSPVTTARYLKNAPDVNQKLTAITNRLFTSHAKNRTDSTPIGQGSENAVQEATSEAVQGGDKK